jgi:small subunit ribosomal protein S3
MCYARSQSYSSMVASNLTLRKEIEGKYAAAQIAKIYSEFSKLRTSVNIHCRKPGMIVGPGGSEVEALRARISKLLATPEVVINVHEVKAPDLDAVLVAKSVATQLEKGLSFRKVMKKAVQSSMRQGALGIKVACAGRLAGAEIARTEKQSEGTIPLHTLRAMVEHAKVEANTPYGVIGVKVWIYRGEQNKSYRAS